MCGHAGVQVQGVHLLRAVSVRGALTLMRANWMETASFQSDASSLWLQSFWSSLLLSFPLLLSVCLSPSPLSLCHRPEADERSPLWHMTHTLLSFEFFHLADPLHHYTPTPTYFLTCMRAYTLTHSLLPLIPLSLTRQSMEELLLRHSAGMLWGRYWSHSHMHTW